MAYSALSDIQSEFKALTFSASTTPTSTAVGGFITQADAEIDARVGLKYVTPVTGTTSLAILQRISTMLVVGRVKKILEGQADQPRAR
jgi:hypothetical protein